MILKVSLEASINSKNVSICSEILVPAALANSSKKLPGVALASVLLYHPGPTRKEPIATAEESI
jgi:hypothetical protein